LYDAFSNTDRKSNDYAEPDSNSYCDFQCNTQPQPNGNSYDDTYFNAATASHTARATNSKTFGTRLANL